MNYHHLSKEVSCRKGSHETTCAKRWFLVLPQFLIELLHKHWVIIGISDKLRNLEDLTDPSDAKVAAQSAPPDEGMTITMKVEMMGPKYSTNEPINISHDDGFGLKYIIRRKQRPLS